MEKIELIEDTYKYYLNLNKKYIFREFLKKKDIFIATNNFYLSYEIDDQKKKEFINEKNKIIPYNNIHIEMLNNNLINYIHLILISNISFYLNDININKYQIIKKFIEQDIDIENELLKDLYYNNDFSEKINVKIPNKTILNNNLNKKYLFKIELNELHQNIQYENIE
jgi:hypothetical protein